ncbi:hypothetical protein [Neptunicella sp. SCSIO 80796]|uniref:hypothetical protein n=1 Tax=Neptunicella plasticusilytica TaxID=3117012 RepID=UPI003A4E63CF
MIILITALLTFAEINPAPGAEAGIDQTELQLQKRYTQPGYPFGNLAIKADQVTLRITDSQGGRIHCGVDVTFGSHSWSSDIIEAQQDDFNRDPLRACLPRDTAKKFLKALYQVH